MEFILSIFVFIPRSILAILFSVLILTSQVLAGEIVVGGTDYWNPYCYCLKDDVRDLRGYTVDITKSILGKNNELVFNVLPWKRCLRMLECGQVDIVLDSSMNQKRLSKYVFSDPIYHVENVFFYSKRKFPSGPDINSVSDVEKYSLGGIAGYNYSVYPFDVSRSEKGALDYKALLAMVKHERFDLALGLKQVILSYAEMNDLSLDGIGWIPMPEVPPLSFHIIANKSPKGERLIQRINEGLKSMKDSGELDVLNKTYGIN